MIFDANDIWQSPSPAGQWPFLSYTDFQWLDAARTHGRITVDPSYIALMKKGCYLTLGQGEGLGTLRDVEGMSIQDVTLYTGSRLCETMAEAWAVGFVARWSVPGGIGIAWCDPERSVDSWRVTPIARGAGLS